MTTCSQLPSFRVGCDDAAIVLVLAEELRCWGTASNEYVGGDEVGLVLQKVENGHA